MKAFITIIAAAAAMIAAPVSAKPTKPSETIGANIKPCKVVAPMTEKEMKIAIRKMKRQGLHVEVTRGGSTKVVAQGGDAFPSALAHANVVKSGC